MPLDQADETLGGVAAKPWVDGRSLQERLQPQPASGTDLWAAAKSLTDFSEVEGLTPLTMRREDAAALLPRAAHELQTLQARVELRAGQAVARQRPIELDAEQFAAQAFEVVDSSVGADLAAAEGEAKLRVYSAGRALLNHTDSWYRNLLLELEP
jgi:hypothetical protein